MGRNVTASQDDEIKFDIIDYGNSLTFNSSPYTMVITNHNLWNDTWTDFKSHHSNPDPLPIIDFESDMILLVSTGMHGSLCGMNITSIQIMNAQLKVSITDECSDWASVTYPTMIVKLPAQLINDIIVEIAIVELIATDEYSTIIATTTTTPLVSNSIQTFILPSRFIFTSNETINSTTDFTFSSGFTEFSLVVALSAFPILVLYRRPK